MLTEVGSNYYLYTPIIAAIANAGQVYARTVDSRYGKGSDLRRQCMQIAEACGVADRIEILVNADVSHCVSDSDIITNSGFLRPLSENLLSRCKSGAVVPLMYDSWELRDHDVDIEYCRESGIKVAGTWEDHPSIAVFSSVGTLAVKLALEAGFEVYQNRVAVWSDDPFGDISRQAFINTGAESAEIYNNVDALITDLPDLDFVYLCDYDESRDYFGPNGIFDIHRMKAVNPTFGMVHLFGRVDASLLKDNGLTVFPQYDGHASHMSCTLGHLGPKPIISLQVAGFRVAQEMIDGRYSDLSQPITF